ncbi:MAG: hypothetical protein JXR94_10810 [Candidatus Hydrogenedentes bacterium]|nr:hypothetical protein [Candidatus Hydrogenedentota bacterium]
MSDISSVSSVGTGLRAVQFQAEYQAAVLREQKQVIEDVGNAALQLIQAALAADPDLGQNLHVVA